MLELPNQAVVKALEKFLESWATELSLLNSRPKGFEEYRTKSVNFEFQW